MEFHCGQIWKQPSSQGHSTKRKQKLFPGVYRRSKIDKDSGEIVPHGKWLPRLKPPREQLSAGKKLIHDHLPLGGYDTPEDAKIVRDIAASYYGKAEGELTLANGQVFPIPPMTEVEKQSVRGLEKRQWVCRKAREVFQNFQMALKAAAPSMRNAGTLAVSSDAAATAVVASSPETTGSPQPASLSPEDCTSKSIFEVQLDFGSDYDIDTSSGRDPFSLPSMSWDEWDALGSTSQGTTSMEMDRLQQPWESQNL